MHKNTLVVGISLIAVLFVPSIANSKTIDDNNESVENKNNKINVIKKDIETLSLSQTSSNLKLDKIDERVIAIDKDIQKLIENDKSFDWITPLTNLCAVIFGALIGGFLSYKIQGRQTKFEISKSLMDWKVKQLSELYGPLYALLHQSNAVYRQMNIVLEKVDSNLFRLVDDSKKADLDKITFQIFINNEWVIFRTITHIDKVYGKDYGVEKYFDELLDIGERMVRIVENKAGYVREDQAELAYIFGQYLAHYTVLRQLHKQIKESFERPGETTISQQLDMPVDHTAAFPREIQGLVQVGYQELNQELNNWGKKAE
jgi:hypothetical protein